MFSNNNRISTRQVFRLFVFDFVGRRGPHPDLIQPSQLRSRPASSAARVRTPSKST